MDYVPSHLYSMCTAIVCLQGNSLFYCGELSFFRERAEDPGRSQIPHHVMRLHHSEAVHLRHYGIFQQKQTGPEAWALRLSRGCFFVTITSLTRCLVLSRVEPLCKDVQFRGASGWWGYDVSMTSSAMTHFLNIILRDDKRNDKKVKKKYNLFHLKSFLTPQSLYQRHFDFLVQRI